MIKRCTSCDNQTWKRFHPSFWFPTSDVQSFRLHSQKHRSASRFCSDGRVRNDAGELAGRTWWFVRTRGVVDISSVCISVWVCSFESEQRKEVLSHYHQWSSVSVRNTPPPSPKYAYPVFFCAVWCFCWWLNDMRYRGWKRGPFWFSQRSRPPDSCSVYPQREIA